MAKKTNIPSCCHHKPTGQAYVRLNGTMHYLGDYDSPESRENYNRLIAEWLAGGRVPLQPTGRSEGPSVNEILLAYLRHAETYYVRADGSPTGEFDNICHAVRPLREMYGSTPAGSFGPRALKAVRQKMIDDDLCRNVINQRVNRIKRVFKWAVSEELLPSAVFHGLQSVSGLRQGRTAARETEPVRAVPDDLVEATLPFMPPTLRAMVRLQRLTGMRSGELCAMRATDIDMSGDTWIYSPTQHKTKHHGHDRPIVLGPQAQNALRPLLRAKPDQFLFSPAQAQAERNAIKRLKRKSKVQPSQRDRRKCHPKRQPGRRYDSRSYYQAVRNAIKQAVKAGALGEDDRWHPHQLRHTCATEIRRQHGLDAARAVLGQHSLDQASEYAELDANLASEVAKKVG